MAEVYNHHLHHQKSFFNKTTFFPLLCRTSVKEVKLRDSKVESYSLSSVNPSSPKISCMGQIRRAQKSSTFSPSPPENPMTSAAVSTKTRDGQVKYTALKRWFSGRKTAGTCIGGCSGSGGEMMVMMSSRRNESRRCSKINNCDDGNFVQSIDKLDPPLPVIKNLIPTAVEVNLWKRRCGGVVLTSLQIKNHIQLAKNNYQIAPPA